MIVVKIFKDIITISDSCRGSYCSCIPGLLQKKTNLHFGKMIHPHYEIAVAILGSCKIKQICLMVKLSNHTMIVVKIFKGIFIIHNI